MNAKKVFELAKKIEKNDLELLYAEDKVVKLRTNKVKLQSLLLSEISGDDDTDPDEED